MKLFKLLRTSLAALSDKLEYMSYNEYTVAAYYRKKGIQVGDHCRILPIRLPSEPYLIKIGNNCAIAYDVAFITHDGAAGFFRDEIPDLNVFGKIEVKDNCFIGLGAKILCNVTIGPHAIVGAGAVVTKDVPPNTVVAGVPARVICTMDDYKRKCIAQWEQLRLTGDRATWEKQLRAHFWQGQ